MLAKVIKSLCILVGVKIASGLDENVIHFSFGEQNWIFTHRFFFNSGNANQVSESLEKYRVFKVLLDSLVK